MTGVKQNMKNSLGCINTNVLVITDMTRPNLKDANNAEKYIKGIAEQISHFDGEVYFIVNDLITDFQNQLVPELSIYANESNRYVGNGAASLAMDLGVSKFDVINGNFDGTFTNISKVEIVGVYTETSVLTSAVMLKSFLPDAKIVVNANLCIGKTPNLHADALRVLSANAICVKI